MIDFAILRDKIAEVIDMILSYIKKLIFGEDVNVEEPVETTTEA